jgi:oligoribonuclease
MAGKEDNLIWIDLEMTGLDPDHDRIIEIATVVTDPALQVVAVGPVMAVHQSDSALNGMDEWNRNHHGASGLVSRVRASRIDEAEAELATVEFLREHVPERTSPMCGNTVCQDRRFLARWMPHLETFFHYRNIDVSTLKELCRRWSPGLPEFYKESRHLALHDIHDSIAELAYYRTHFLRLSP